MNLFKDSNDPVVTDWTTKAGALEDLKEVVRKLKAMGQTDVTAYPTYLYGAGWAVAIRRKPFNDPFDVN